jgi:hypothetical protein
VRVKRIIPRSLDYHRNGVGGAPFHTVIFDEAKGAHPDDQGRKVGIVFEQDGHCAVLDVAFGSNSWRGDEYEPHLRDAIKAHDKAAWKAFLQTTGYQG